MRRSGWMTAPVRKTGRELPRPPSSNGVARGRGGPTALCSAALPRGAPSVNGVFLGGGCGGAGFSEKSGATELGGTGACGTMKIGRHRRWVAAHEDGTEFLRLLAARRMKSRMLRPPTPLPRSGGEGRQDAAPMENESWSHQISGMRACASTAKLSPAHPQTSRGAGDRSPPACPGRESRRRSARGLPRCRRGVDAGRC